MKKIKKLLCLILIFVCSFVVGCDSEKTNTPSITRVKNYGVVQEVDGEDELFVFIPYIGRCPASTCDDGSGLKLEVGDLISLEIVSEVISSDPLQASVRNENLTIRRKNVELELVENRFVLTANFKSDEIENNAYMPFKEVGDIIYFRQILSVGAETEEYCTAEILSKDGERLSLALNIQNEFIQQFLEGFSLGYLKLYAVVEDPLLPENSAKNVDFSIKYESINGYNEGREYPFIKLAKSYEDFALCCPNSFENLYAQEFFSDKYLLILVMQTVMSGQTYKVDKLNYYDRGVYSGLYVIQIAKGVSTEAGASIVGEYYCFIELDKEITISSESQILIV